MNTLTLDQAIDLVPAIGATGPSNKASNSYQFVSSREILERVMQDDWVITGATSQGRTLYAPHRVTLVHKNYLDKVNDLSIEGIPRIEMFNSHNLTKRLLFAIGWFRTLCSNGLIVASGPAETIRTKHRFSDNRLDQIMEQVSAISNRFPIIESKIEEFKSRQLNEEEKYSFAEYAIKGRFLYRPAMPKRFRDIEHTTKLLLAPRRDQDSGNDTWQVFNRVQENLMRGIEGFSRPIRGHSDTVRVNQLLWKGADTTLKFDSQGLNKALMDLLIKDSQKGKISA